MSSSGSSDAASATSQSASPQSSSIESTSPPATTSTPPPATTSTPETTTTPPSSTTTDTPSTTAPVTSSTEPITTPSSTPSPEPITTPTTTSNTTPSTSTTTQQDALTTSISGSPSTVVVVTTPTQITETSNGQLTTVIKTSVYTTTTPNSSTLSTSRVATTTSSSSTSSAISSTSATAAPVSGKHGIGTGGTIAIAITVPLVSVVLLGLLAAFLWKRHQKKKANEEMRRKEVEDYTYNPNNDTSGHSGILGAAGSNSGMSEAEGYRGWGNTAGTRKVSAPLSSSPSAGTALSPVPFGASHSDNGFGNNEMQHDTKIQPAELYGGTPQAELYGGSIPATSPQSPIFAQNQKRHSQAPLLVMPHRPSTADSSTIGAGAVHSPVEADDGLQRGVSNASSRYTNATHNTEGSDGGDVQYPPANQTAHYYANEAPTYYDDMNNNNNTHPQEQYNHYNQYAPMQEQEQQQRPPMIQQVSARRNTRIETPTENHYPLSSHQGNSGIAQNF